jgi:hypothetical protein
VEGGLFDVGLEDYREILPGQEGYRCGKEGGFNSSWQICIVIGRSQIKMVKHEKSS